ncbi:membrane protein insertase YidC [Clostridium sp. MSJ-4]|uniref:Membrane protein insertase YidC n=1 Tax=Clostridium simiarum TaxID=2841506 RepID=A0ABS6F1N0_9CLOT|nr:MULTISPECIES: membrane protein insertase YidC [Clostridium]MBU5592410.1 membrane protein insertase YidC [Clostridium simiarum]
MQILNNVLTQFFEFIHGLIKVLTTNPNYSYGLAIILFTIIIRIILLPLNIKQTRSQVKMQEIQPELQKLQSKYKNDPQKQQEQMMKLYKENGVSPFSGCLPLLIQMPILFALYYVFNNLQGISGVGFLWVNDLSQPDQLYILPVVSFVTQYISTKIISSSSPNNAQAKQMQTMNIFMAGFIGFMSLKFKSALVLYWVINNLIQIAQTYIMKSIDNKPKDDSSTTKLAQEISSDKLGNKNKK